VRNLSFLAEASKTKRKRSDKKVTMIIVLSSTKAKTFPLFILVVRPFAAS